jgi:hypothetical protein
VANGFEGMERGPRARLLYSPDFPSIIIFAARIQIEIKEMKLIQF